MAMFLVERRRSGPEWDAKRPMEEQTGWAEHAAFMDALVESGFVLLGGPLEDERRVALAVEAGSADDVRSTLAADPWGGTHLSDPHRRGVDDPPRRAKDARANPLGFRSTPS